MTVWTLTRPASSLDGNCMSANLPSDTYRLLMDHVQAAVFVVQNGRFLYVNPNLTQLFGYMPEEMLQGMDPVMLTAPEYRDFVR